MRLWHREFWLMAVACLLLALSVTMLIPTMPLWMLYVEGLSTAETGLAMGAFALGLFLPGGLCSYLVQHYRRNLVCVWAALLLAVSVAVPYYLPVVSVLSLMLLRLVQGAAFGLAQMVLSSTLIIDTCDSFQRTEGNHSATWFGRFALSLGPLAGLLLYQAWGFPVVSVAAAGCALLSAVLVLCVHFPFRVPADKVPLWSLDRFFLTQGWPLFLNLLLVTVAIGMLLSMRLDAQFYGLLMVGFLLALLAQRFVFRDAELKSEVVAGLATILAAWFVLYQAPHSEMASPLLGLGLGLVGSRFLLFFIKLSHHCQRGTAQSTFLIGWECGLALGLGLGYGLLGESRLAVLGWSALLLVVALLLYHYYIHQWFIDHKNR